MIFTHYHHQYYYCNHQLLLSGFINWPSFPKYMRLDGISKIYSLRIYEAGYYGLDALPVTEPTVSMETY